MGLNEKKNTKHVTLKGPSLDFRPLHTFKRLFPDFFVIATVSYRIFHYKVPNLRVKDGCPVWLELSQKSKEYFKLQLIN